MRHLLAAVGATAAALVELSLVQYLSVGGAHPHPVLVFGVIWTIAVGVESGLTWAFVGGIALDTLATSGMRPLGVSPFALLICVGGASAIGRSFVRIRPLAPIIAVPILSLVNSMLIFGLLAAIRPTATAADPIALFMPGAAYDAVLGIVFGPLVVSILDRRDVEERAAW
jgi:rod shape-determining protein MreD